jgi:NAD(P)-dependent dehydrogenase (short-subunit alcohol dehydrogenase family)
VTGGAEGIGNAIARCLASFGADIVVADINRSGAEDAARQVRAIGRRAIAVECDVTKQEDVDRMMSVTLEELGAPHILVNNVGGTIRKLFMEMTDEEWHAMLDLNLTQAFRCTRAAARLMIDQGVHGSIINLTTIEAYRGAPGFAPYAAAKAGLASFTKTMALELGPSGIRVNSIAPDITPTPGIMRIAAQSAQTSDGFAQRVPMRVPLGRMGIPEDYGGAAIFLASDLSKWITGQVIHVDGGTYAASGFHRSEAGHWRTI